MKRVKRYFISIICFSLMLTCLTPITNASQADVPPVSNLAVQGSIISEDYATGKTITEQNPRYKSITNSLWYTDPNFPVIKQNIKVYDNGGVIKHSRDGVEITIRQTGQTNYGRYIMLNGKQTTLPSSYKIVSSYPRQFIQDTTYTIDRRNVPENETYTIFTFGCMSTQNNQRTRYEVNVYIYWNDVDAVNDSSSIPALCDLVVDLDPNGYWYVCNIEDR